MVVCDVTYTSLVLGCGTAASSGYAEDWWWRGAGTSSPLAAAAAATENSVAKV